MPRVLLDVDGVLANFDKAARTTISRLVTRQVVIPERGDRFGNLTEEERTAVFAEISSVGWCAALEPLPGAIAGVRAIQEIADVYIVTAPWTSPTWVHERYNWLATHVDIPQDHVVVTHAKYTVVGDVFVDDKPSHVRAWGESHPHGHPVLWQDQQDSTLPTCYDWNALIERIREL